MICEKCGTHVPEDKIYCEKCGTAVQIVPDYNPMEDITIGAEEAPAENPVPAAAWWHRWRYGLAGIVLAAAGFFSFQTAYEHMRPAQETAVKPEVVPVLEGRPQFGPRPGTYSSSPMLTISYPHNGAGDIHYTMDGTTPDEESSRYDSPVSIGEGMTVVRAVFIREDGVQSEEAAGTYHVEFQCPAEPVFSIPAGTYEGGITVTITGDEGSRIYYTTNGEEPGIRSKLYQGPVRIGPGLTVLQAIAVDQEGGSSAIVEAIYNVSEISGALESPDPGLSAAEPAIP